MDVVLDTAPVAVCHDEPNFVQLTVLTSRIKRDLLKVQMRDVFLQKAIAKQIVRVELDITAVKNVFAKHPKVLADVSVHKHLLQIEKERMDLVNNIRTSYGSHALASAVYGGLCTICERFMVLKNLLDALTPYGG